MRIAVFALALALPGMASAQTIRAQAGDHPGFTRLVLDLPQPASWKLGRTAEGYEVQIDGIASRYDLTGVFRVISRRRLASIWADPASGNLRIGVGCACHAVSFEDRPDILVIDLRDGPPDDGTVETALDGRAMPALIATAAPTLRPRPAPGRPRPEELPQVALPRPQPNPTPLRVPDLPPLAENAEPPDWRAVLAQIDPTSTLLRFPDVGPSTSHSLDNMRLALIKGLAQAATSGVIEVDKPIFLPTRQLAVRSGPDTVDHLAVGNVPGFAARSVNQSRPALTAAGEVCLPDASLDIAGWADDRAFDSQIATARDGLVGEFDRPDPDRIARYVRLLLHFGFGAEARDVLSAYPLDDKDEPLWRTMSYIVDGEPAAVGTAFADQLSCSGSAALWAALGTVDPAQLRRVDLAAVSTTFSVLPLDLRRNLGPGLAEKFISTGDMATAQIIHNAIWRAPGDPGPAARLAAARLDVARGDLAVAAERLQTVSRETGPSASKALADLVDTKLALKQSVDAGTIDELAALAYQSRGGPMEFALIRAEILARGSAGDFLTAFAMLQRNPDATSGLWRLLAESGSDAALLDTAILPVEVPVPLADPEIRRLIGGRLLELGFPEDALRWLPGQGEAADDLQLARAELQLGNARGALRTLSGQPGDDAERLRAQALERLGDQSGAAEALARAGETEARSAALWRAEDWTRAAENAPQQREAALKILSPDVTLPAPDPDAPLSQARTLLDNSAQARAAITALLEAGPISVETGP